jgi:hypothetical protein
MIKLEGAHLRERIALIIGAGVSQGIDFLTAEAMPRQRPPWFGAVAN